jgi:hypothetical protein
MGLLSRIFTPEPMYQAVEETAAREERTGGDATRCHRLHHGRRRFSPVRDLLRVNPETVYGQKQGSSLMAGLSWVLTGSQTTAPKPVGRVRQPVWSITS